MRRPPWQPIATFIIMPPFANHETNGVAFSETDIVWPS